MIANSPTDMLMDLIVDAEAYPVLEEENEWANKKSAYEAISFDTTFGILNDPDLSSFMVDAQNENFATIAWTDEMLKQYDYYFAKYLVNGLSPQNLMEQNYKTFTNCYILWCENPEREFSLNEINNLYAVANQCANLGGKSVIQAQVFLDYILHQEANWNTNCPIPASALRKANLKIKEQLSKRIQIDENFEIELSPNPSNYQLIIKSKVIEFPFAFDIYNILGDKIISWVIKSELEFIDVSAFSNGIYFAKFYLPNNKILTKKLLIAKN